MNKHTRLLCLLLAIAVPMGYTTPASAMDDIRCELADVALEYLPASTFRNSLLAWWFGNC